MGSEVAENVKLEKACGRRLRERLFGYCYGLGGPIKI